MMIYSLIHSVKLRIRLIEADDVLDSYCIYQDGVIKCTVTRCNST